MPGQLMFTSHEVLRERYLSAEPFPHLVMDDVFPVDELRTAMADWPKPNSKLWGRVEMGKFSYGKHGKILVEDVPESLKHHVEFGSNREFVSLLESVTGLDDLIPDNNLGGSGLHDTGRGGFLNMHLDFNNRDLNVHPNGSRIKEERDIVYRRLNVFLYLNEDWEDEWNGQLELASSPDGKRKKISPLFNRIVIAQCNESSWHGHPEPMTCPKDVRRRSIAWYYYTHEKPDDFREKHSTKYLKKRRK